MINVNELKKAIDDSGYKLTFIAKKLNLSYQGFLNKMQGKYEFNLAEITGNLSDGISAISKVLNLTDERKKKIFFV